jgi:hypothetical protein
MNYSLAYTLGKYRAGRTDPDAAAYIAAVTTAGATVTSAQGTFIDNFYKAAKLDYYTSLKRLYLPIWGVAAANAIDMIGLTSGTFNGGVTHGAGFVQSNGTTGWFDTGVTPGTLGLSPSTAYLCALAKTEMINSRAIGSRNSISQDMNLTRISLSLGCGIMANTFAAGQIQGLATCSGILSGSRVGGTRFVARRDVSGRSNLASVTDADFGTTPTVNIGLMAGNIVTTGASAFTNNEFGAFAIGTGLTDTEDSNFTLALKNLWEGCTNLILP